MAVFDNIIQEINTNLPDNNTQAITAAKLRTTLIDLTDTIEEQQNDFETQVEETISEIDPVFATNQSVNEVSIINNFTDGGVNNVASAETVKTLNTIIAGGSSIEAETDGTSVWNQISGLSQYVTITPPVLSSWATDYGRTSYVIDLSSYKSSGYNAIVISANNNASTQYTLLKSTFPATNITGNITSSTYMPMLASVMANAPYKIVDVSTVQTVDISDSDIYYIVFTQFLTTGGINLLPNAVTIQKLINTDGLVINTLDSESTTQAPSVAKVKELKETVDSLDDTMDEVNDLINGKEVTTTTEITSDSFTLTNGATKPAGNWTNSSAYNIYSVIKIIPPGVTRIVANCANSGSYFGLAFYSTSHPSTDTFVSGVNVTATSGNSVRTVEAVEIPNNANYVVCSIRKQAGVTDGYLKFITDKTVKPIEDRLEDLSEPNPDVVRSLTSEKRSDVKDGLRPLKILFVGNSFSYFSSQTMPSLFSYFNKQVVIGAMYQGGGTVQDFYNNRKGNGMPYYKTNSSGTYVSQGSKTVEYVFNDENWDVIFFIQGSASAGLYTTYVPYYSYLLDWTQSNVQSLGYVRCWFMPWAWSTAKIENDGGNLDGATTNEGMYANICTATQYNEAANPSKFVVPCGTAAENLYKNYYPSTGIWEDGQHLDSLGCFTAGATVFGIIADYFYGIKLSDIPSDTSFTVEHWQPTESYHTDTLSSTQVGYAIDSATKAIANPYQVTLL